MSPKPSWRTSPTPWQSCRQRSNCEAMSSRRLAPFVTLSVRRPTYRNALRVLLRLPGVYHLAAFLTGRRVAVRGWSMYPSLAPGERVLFDRLAYVSARPRRGDIVLAVHPGRPHIRMIKRVAAVPGDTVATDGVRCWVNGEPADRRPSPAGNGVPEGRVLGRGEYFLLGDALDSST